MNKQTCRCNLSVLIEAEGSRPSSLSRSSFSVVCVCVCFQLEEIRNIGSLPCLEKLNLSSNPMCIIPDYRTKVLAQFGDRAAEVHHQGYHTVNVTTVLLLLLLQQRLAVCLFLLLCCYC